MKKENLIIKNFGPIKEVNIELKKINIFIGGQSTGKSTISKLISIFRDPNYWKLKDEKVFEKHLNKFNIHSYLKKNSVIEYVSENCHFSYNGKGNETIIKVNDSYYKGFANSIKELQKMFSSDDVPEPKEVISLLIDNSKKIIELLKEEYKFLKENKTVPKKIIKEREELEKIDNAGQCLLDLVDNFQKDSVYIPAERIVISNLSNIGFQLEDNNVSLPKYIIEFGSLFQKSRSEINKVKLEMLKITYDFSSNEDKILLGKSKSIYLTEASSGVQSLTPLYLVVENASTKDNNITTLVIEEPELHLFPKNQNSLIEYLISKSNKNNDELVLTTHSPYVLSSLNKLLYASIVGELDGKKSKVSKIISEDKWISPSIFTCYFISDGKCRSIIDSETGLISQNELDNISTSISEDFNELVDIQLEI